MIPKFWIHILDEFNILIQEVFLSTLCVVTTLQSCIFHKSINAHWVCLSWKRSWMLKTGEERKSARSSENSQNFCCIKDISQIHNFLAVVCDHYRLPRRFTLMQEVLPSNSIWQRGLFNCMVFGIKNVRMTLTEMLKVQLFLFYT